MAALDRRYRNLDIAEESAAEAFAVAARTWPEDGVPANPAAWLHLTANRKALDRVRREAKRPGLYEQMHRINPPASQRPGIPDDRLRLIVTCCHPVLPPQSRVALTLRLVGGLTVPEIAKGLLTSEAAIGRRITRAKQIIAESAIPYRVPTPEELPTRVADVLATVMLIFNEGYLASGRTTEPMRHDLTEEAIHLARQLHALIPRDGETTGLLALMLMTQARSGARIDASGALVPLADQDRGAWDQDRLAEGHALILDRLRSTEAPGPYQLQAAINLEHTRGRRGRDTDWSRVVGLYNHLLTLDPSPVVALNRAIAVAELDGPEAALALVEPLQEALAGYHAFHVTRAELLLRARQPQPAITAFQAAIDLAANTAEAAHLRRRLAAATSFGADR